MSWGAIILPTPSPHIASSTAVHLVNGVSWLKVARATPSLPLPAQGSKHAAGLWPSGQPAHCPARGRAVRGHEAVRAGPGGKGGSCSAAWCSVPLRSLCPDDTPPWGRPPSAPAVTPQRAAVRTCPATEPYLSAPPVAPSPAAELTGPSSQVFFNFFLTVVKYIEPTFCHMEPR